MKIHIFLTVIGLSFMISCEQSSEFTPQPKTMDNEVSLSVKSGILAFENWRDFYEMADLLGKLPVDKRRSREAEYGFISKASVHEDILEAEESEELEYYQPYLNQGYTESQIVALGIPRPSHSKLYLAARKKGTIIIFEDSDTASTYSINAPIPYASCLNSEGFVIVGDTLSLLLRGSIKHWIGGKIASRHSLFRATNSDASSGILVANVPENGLQKTTDSWGSASYFNRWVYESGSNPKRRAAYEIRGWSTDYSISNPTEIVIEHWFDLYAHKKRWGKWAARSNYRPDFHIAGNWTHTFGRNAPHGCDQINYVYSTWSNNNNSHNSDFISPINNAIVPADGYSHQYETLYPDGTFQLSEGFCDHFRVIQMDVNVHAIGDGGGNLDLVAHIFSE